MNKYLIFIIIKIIITIRFDYFFISCQFTYKNNILHFDFFNDLYQFKKKFRKSSDRLSPYSILNITKKKISKKFQNFKQVNTNLFNPVTSKKGKKYMSFQKCI